MWLLLICIRRHWISLNCKIPCSCSHHHDRLKHRPCGYQLCSCNVKISHNHCLQICCSFVHNILIHLLINTSIPRNSNSLFNRTSRLAIERRSYKQWQSIWTPHCNHTIQMPPIQQQNSISQHQNPSNLPHIQQSLKRSVSGHHEHGFNEFARLLVITSILNPKPCQTITQSIHAKTQSPYYVILSTANKSFVECWLYFIFNAM